MSDAAAAPAPVTASPVAERDAAIAMLQASADTLSRAGAPKGDTAPKAKGKATEAAPAAAEPAAEEAPAEAQDGAEEAAPAEEAPAAPEQPKSPPWKAYERKRARLREEAEGVRRARAELEAQLQANAPLFEDGKRFRAMREQATSDPLSALEALGLTYEQLTRAVLSGDDDRERRKAADAAAEPIKKEIEALRSERQQAAVHQAEREFVSLASRAEAFPELSVWVDTFGPQAVLTEAYGVADQLRSAWGRNPSDEEIARELDRRAGIFHTKVRGAAPSAIPARTTGPGERAKSSVTRAPTTISQRHASETSGKGRDETEEERVSRARELLAQGLRKK